MAGILFALLFAAAWILVRSALPASVTADPDWLDDEGAAARIRVGLALVPFAGIAFLWFIGVIRDRFKDSEDQLFSTVFIGSGLLFLAMVFVSAAIAGGIVTIVRITDDASGTGVADFGRAVMLEVSNIYALRMAGVLLISLGTMWLRTGVMPRWLAFVTYAAAILLLLITTLGLRGTLVFPAWVLGEYLHPGHELRPGAGEAHHRLVRREARDTGKVLVGAPAPQLASACEPHDPRTITGGAAQDT